MLPVYAHPQTQAGVGFVRDLVLTILRHHKHNLHISYMLPNHFHVNFRHLKDDDPCQEVKRHEGDF